MFALLYCVFKSPQIRSSEIVSQKSFEKEKGCITYTVLINMSYCSLEKFFEETIMSVSQFNKKACENQWCGICTNMLSVL